VNFLFTHIHLDGNPIIADVKRTNTQEFYYWLYQAWLHWTREEINEREDNLPLLVSIVTIQRRGEGG
jgi:hypothetical protein